MKKSTKWNKFFSSLFYAVLLALPMLSVIARVIYVQSNNNAKDSYSDFTLLSNQKVSSNYTYVENDNCVISINYVENDTTNIGFKGVFDYDFHAVNAHIDNSLVKLINLSNQNRLIYVYQLVNGVQTFYSSVPYPSDNFSLSFVYKSFDVSTYSTYNYNARFELFLNFFVIGTIDNAFEYSISKVVDDFGVGNINFVNWFGNMFFDNPQNLLYLNFVNMYLNYTLLVSVAYLMYLFLSFFIQIIRELVFSFIDKTNKVGD